MNYWIHRISHQANLSYPLLDKGFLSIGFSDFIDSNLIDRVLEDDWGYFTKQFNIVWGKEPRTRYNLYRFLRFAKGDIVIVPGKGTFSVYEVIDDRPLPIGETYSQDLSTWGGNKVITDGKFLKSEGGERYDLGFARKVKVLYQNVSRAKFADAKLTSRMKIRQTNALINDLGKSVEKSISNYQLNKPIHLHSILIEKTSSLVLEAIKAELNPDKFEKLLKTYFKAIGANEVSIPAKNAKGKEGDADIVAVFESLKLIIYTQAKFQKGQIKEWGANQILDYKSSKESIDDGYNKIAWLITTASSFNPEAEKLAKENEIQLIDGLEFSKMLLNVGINLLDTSL